MPLAELGKDQAPIHRGGMPLNRQNVVAVATKSKALIENQMINRTESRLLLFFLVSAPLVHAEKDSREWEADLEKQFTASKNYVAKYESVSPGKDGVLKITVAELREIGAAMIEMSAEGESMMSILRIPRGHSGEGVYYSVGEQKSVVVGFEEGFAAWAAGLEALRKSLHDNAPVRNLKWHWSAAPCYLDGMLNVSLRLHNEGEAPWLNDMLTRFATKVEESGSSVIFTLPDELSVSIDQQSGLLSEQRVMRGGQQVVLRLKKVDALKGIEDFQKILPKENWNNAEKVPFGQAPMAEELTRIGAQVLMTAAMDSNFTSVELGARLKQERKQLIDYWKVTHGSKFSLLVTKRKVRIMRGSLLAEYQKFVDRDPLAPKRLGFLPWLQQERSTIERKLAGELSGSDAMRATRGEMEPWLPLASLPLPLREKVVVFLRQFFDSANAALAMMLMDEVVKDE
jgi:hypothetical protein